MMTQAVLSDGPRAHAQKHVRNSSFQPQASTFQNPWPPYGGRLIANLELEFDATTTKQSAAAISNRKYFAVFHFDCHSPVAYPVEDHGRRRATERLKSPRRLIANARLEIAATCTKQSIATKSNRERMAIFHLAFCTVVTRSPLHSTFAGAFLIGTLDISKNKSTCCKHTSYRNSN
jgi:hypothetical protein